ncbi:shematrin-like protein 2 [Centruroides vittatus]|uniref:shematrin-like protein 2 n=1 Tax=Centruroides vittatus TaxID=120091 RepID=UPI003510CFB5
MHKLKRCYVLFFQQIFILFVLLAAVFAEETKTETSENKGETLQNAETYPTPVYASNYGHGFGDFGYMKKGYGEFGYAGYGDLGRYRDRGYGAYGGHLFGGYRDYDRYGGHGGALDRYRDVDAYARNKGVGYERAYAYDKKAGYRNHAGDKAAYADHYGRHGRLGELGASSYGAAGFDRHLARDKFGDYGYGGYGRAVGDYGRYGHGGHTAMYFNAPGYGYHY